MCLSVSIMFFKFYVHVLNSYACLIDEINVDIKLSIANDTLVNNFYINKLSILMNNILLIFVQN